MLIGPAGAGYIHVMSCNVRIPVDRPPHSWQERSARVAQLLRTEQPTVLGTQEAHYNQVRDIARGSAMSYIHLARDGGGGDESAAVFYDPDRLEPLDFRHLWLSDTPFSMGSASWGNEITRMLTWVRFLDVDNGKQFIVLNTHFDHVSAAARDKAAAMVSEVVGDFDVPCLVTGDFNAAADSAPHHTLETGLSDTWDTAAVRLTDHVGTFNAFDSRPKVEGNRIDWILVTAGVEVHRAAINTWTVDGLPPSDHWPVQALVSLVD